jgi:hypothetical protein
MITPVSFVRRNFRILIEENLQDLGNWNAII